MFTDRVHLLVQAGNGGDGCDSVHRRTDRKVIYNGGDGGDGGSIVFRAAPNAPPIAHLRYKQHILAESGGHGSSNKKRGKNGEDLIVLVPAGTRIFDRRNGLLIRELGQEGEDVIVAKGGRGGVGNIGHKDSQPGQPGEILELEVSLLLRADVFLVGLPNSGKSSLLNVLTRTHAKEEAYPFATKSPELGVCSVSDFESVTLCELPSIYAASHEGHGLGTDFLKHLAKARLILYVVDPVSQFCSSLSDGFKILRNQVKIYDKEFLKTPSAVVMTKADLPEGAKAARGKKWKPGVPVFFVSAREKTGLDKLKTFLGEKIASR
jgi:GTP-binding protein